MINHSDPRRRKLSDVPLWRLLVMLDDAERLVGVKSDAAQALVREIQTRLRNSSHASVRGQGGKHAP
jgi:hypothetical protein